MDITKKPYEISLWEDVLVWVGESGTKYYDIQEMREPVAFQYYEEVKLCTIGSNTMSSQNRAINPKLARKVNGENSFTFTVYYQYIDNITGEKIENPYVQYLVSERKLKLNRDGEWFDFIIKNIQENSETKAFTYTCKDLFVTELSKTGFEIVLDNELENNMGTVEYLAGKILEGSDWNVISSDNPLKQYVEEPLYKVTLGSGINIINIENEKDIKTLKANDSIYVFYSNINDKKPQLQLLYEEAGEFKTNDDLIVDKSHTNYVCDGFNGEAWPDFIGINTETRERLVQLTNLRGNRLVKQSKTKYDSTIDKYVNVYNNNTIYGFTESEYVTSGGVNNYVANPSNFTSTSGWQTDASQLDYKLVTNKSKEGLFESYIEIDFANKQNALVMNAGIGGNRSTIKKLTEGQEYILRMKYKIGDKAREDYATIAPVAKICEYHLENSQYVISKIMEGKDVYNIFDFIAMEENDRPQYTNEQKEVNGKYDYLDEEDPNYIYMKAICSRSISETQLADWDFKIGLFFDFNTDNKVYIEEVQVFPYQTYIENNIKRLCVPGGKLHSEIKTKYIYYQPNPDWQSIKDLIPLSESYEENKNYIPWHEAGSQFTKVRSINAKESNRFNLLQQLCETFQTWMKIKVERDEDNSGKLKLDENFRPIKSIYFAEEVGKYNHAGFRYGINSKSIQRTIDSSAIVSKMIVKDNANEFAPNGFCSIARATENPTGENFLLNFDHYVRHKLLDFDVITNDLYLEANGYLGYYAQLKRENIQRNNQIDIQAGLLIDIMNYEAAYTTYKTSYDGAVDEQLIAEKDFCKLLGQEIKHELFGKEAEVLVGNREDLNKYWVKWCQCENIIKQHKPLYLKAQENLKLAETEYEKIAQSLEELANRKKVLWLNFYKKYSRFIQEGSWLKEDYTDPNLYYIDAESTLHSSTQPKVTYNISVIDISPLEGYEDYDFDLGDISYIEDVEFFGYSRKKDGAAPYREEIVVSEITLELDAPEKTQIKVQNYKSQFEDLFQRITAQTQQAEYHTGEYNRAASIVETDGRLSISTLENSFANNSLTLSNARDQSVIWNDQGITTSSLSNPSQLVRIVSGGIFLSTDGGQSWKTGITGAGINTSYLTTGQINTNEIYIMNGNNAAFRWDEKGLAAYGRNGDYYDPYQFVRFDHHGIYGVSADQDWTGTDEEIHNKAHFALTWSGFSLKNEDGSVRISTNSDIQVFQGENEMVKIGRLDEGIYGIRIQKSNGEAVMESDNEGKLWLRKELNVGANETSTVQIGYLDETRPDSDKREVIHAGDSNNSDDTPFIVYEDGHVVAKYIEALGGKIGNMDISQIDSVGYEVLIICDKGTVIQDDTGFTLTAEVYHNGKKLDSNDNITYQWYNGTTELTGENSYTLARSDAFSEGQTYAQYRCEVTVGEKEE